MAKKIVFVLGAAANFEIDPSKSMPIGSELATRIQIQIRTELQSQGKFPTGDISDALSRSPAGLSQDHVEAMRRIEQGITFKESIDEFIDEWSDFPLVQDVGKLAIAVEILKAEQGMHFSKSSENAIGISAALQSIRDSWLGTALRLINPQIRRRDVSSLLTGISFVTFNYDRCLEFALYHFLQNSQGLEQDQAFEAFRAIPIYHSYGSLGEFNPLGQSNVPFGASLSNANAAAKKIRTFTEEVSSEHAESIRRVVSDADILVFLGFGFHDRNIDLLFENLPNANTAIWGTVCGIRPPRIDAIRSRLSPSGRPFVLLGAWQCRELLWDHQDHIFN